MKTKIRPGDLVVKGILEGGKWYHSNHGFDNDTSLGLVVSVERRPRGDVASVWWGDDQVTQQFVVGLSTVKETND